MYSEIFNRTQLLLGPDALQRLKETRVLLFGVGGVGSWCAESLVRTGIGHITMVDPDRVSESNINRQLPATTQTVGQYKVDVLCDRLRSISPEAEIIGLKTVYTPETAAQFQLESFDYVIDAIDALADKAALILHATSLPVRFYSSMGAALKMDPTRIRVAEFWKVTGCPLGAALRRRFKRTGQLPRRKFKCVFSDELLPNAGTPPEAASLGALDARKAQINGSLMHITAIFGLTLAGLVIQDVCKNAPTKN